MTFHSDERPEAGGGMLARAISFSVWLALNMEALMPRKMPVPEIPPVPVPRPPGSTKAAGMAAVPSGSAGAIAETRASGLAGGIWGRRWLSEIRRAWAYNLYLASEETKVGSGPRQA